MFNIATKTSQALTYSLSRLTSKNIQFQASDITSRACELWDIKDYSLTNKHLEISGVCVIPEHINNLAFTLNQRFFDEIKFVATPEPLDLSSLIGQKLKRLQFSCRIDTPNTIFKKPFAQLALSYANQLTYYPDQFKWYFFNPDLQLGFPSEQQMFRVTGIYSPCNFILGGSSTFYKLNNILQSRFNKDWNSYDKVLDWGCGCGRVTRYFNTTSCSVHGADIDQDNIEWCQNNLPFAAFNHLNLLPPTPYQANHFNLIYGISVFTHLREETQKHWLEELHRIAAPGALVMMTIHGLAAWALIDLAEGYRNWLKETIATKGFVITSEKNEQISDVLNDKSYYVDVFHSHDYVRKTWGDYFEILEIVPSFVFGHDLVIMVKS